MDRYIGTKIVLAEPMDEVTFMFRVRSLPDVVTVERDGKGRPGYLVVYEDGYRSWSPKEVFERAYRRMTEGEIDLIDNPQRREDLTARRENLITAGAPHERATAVTRGGFLIRQLPADPVALRISIGEAHEKRHGDSAYLVFRGDPEIITALLRRALAALDGPLNELKVETKIGR